MSKKNDDFVGDIVYEEGSKIPFIECPLGKEMPKRLFIYGYMRTGEFEPGPDGSEVPICDVDIFQYFNYNHAKKVLDAETLDKVRVAFGLEPLKDASQKGQEILDKVSQNVKNDKVH